MHGRRKWRPTPMFLPGESQGRGAGWAAVCGVTQSQTRLKRLSSSSSGCAGRQNPEPGAKITYNFPSGPSLGAFEPRVVNQVQTKFEPRVFSGQSPDRLLLSNAGRSWWPQRPQHSGNDASAQEQSNQWEKAVHYSTFTHSGRSVVSDSVRPHGPQPTRLLCSWNFPGKNT